jgi:hypothetical protein
LPVVSQQPFGHELASQPQIPFVPHVWPVAQGAQAPPALPQAAAVGVVQTPSVLQQPSGHEVALQAHAPALQVWPAAHGAQAAPTLPQAAAVVGDTH